MNGKGKIPKNRFQAIAKKYPLYLAIAGVAVSFIFSLENYAFEKGMVNFNVMDTYIYAVEMSGKTVLFKTICGFLSCDEGTVSVNGKVMGKDKDMLTEAGIIIEDPGFLRNWSAYHNLEFLYTIRNRPDKSYLHSVLNTVGLDSKLKRPVGKFSLGMRQRLALAQAIMEDPDILLLDEPMNGLDNSGVSEMRNYLLQLREKGKTILLISHSIEDINTLCDTVHEMDHGVLTEKEHISSECLDHNLKN